MKKILLSCCCAVMLFSQTADEFYQKAVEFEKNGDLQNAMMYYKMSAKKSLDFENTIQKDITNEADKKPIIQTKTSKTDYKNNALEDSLGIDVYKPNYLIYAHDFSGKSDRKDGEAKFQISIEKPIAYDLFGFKETLFVAYSQKSFWQISKDSAPFRENNYEPEIFITIPNNFENYDFINWVKFGINHHSNGQGGEESRSWNRAYVSTKLGFGNFSVTPRAWYAFAKDRYNKDINDYMGYGDIELGYDLYGHKFTAMLRNNLKLNGNNRGAAELSWHFPLFKDIYGYLQYFNGYGESLIDYDRQVNKIGLGISIVR